MISCSPPQGAEGGSCYPNDTCDAGLVCLSDACVSLDDSGSGGSGGNGAGGQGSGGQGSGGQGSGGQATGGEEGSGGDSNSGGTQGDGGTSNGGSASGGAATGGTSTGGTPSGGGSTGGSPTGGAAGAGAGAIFDGDGVSIEAPEYGITGNFFILEDSVNDGTVVDDNLTHTDLDPPDDEDIGVDEVSSFESSSSPCVSGVVAVVTDEYGDNCEINDEDCVWDILWGGGIGLTLNETNDSVMAWDASTAGVSGFTFSTNGTVDGIPVRFMVEDTSGEQFCTNITVGTTQVAWSDLQHNCWDPDSGNLDPSEIQQVSWQFVPDASYSYEITSFCIESLNVTSD